MKGCLHTQTWRDCTPPVQTEFTTLCEIHGKRPNNFYKAKNFSTYDKTFMVQVL